MNWNIAYLIHTIFSHKLNRMETHDTHISAPGIPATGEGILHNFFDVM